MTALQKITSALLTDDPPSDDFEFESEYVRSLLRQQRTPSPIVLKNGNNYDAVTGKENIDRWRTPVTVGANVGRTILGQRDVNSGLVRSATITENTPAVTLTSSYVTLCILLIVVNPLPQHHHTVLPGIQDEED